MSNITGGVIRLKILRRVGPLLFALTIQYPPLLRTHLAKLGIGVNSSS